ncbi:hypothetical protein Nmel_008140, partial [Mimus melanotis]
GRRSRRSRHRAAAGGAGPAALPRRGAAAPHGAHRARPAGLSLGPQGHRAAARQARQAERLPRGGGGPLVTESQQTLSWKGQAAHMDRRVQLLALHSTIPKSHVRACERDRNSSGARSGSVGTREGTRVLSVREAEPLPSRRALLFAPAACSTVGVGSKGFLSLTSLCLQEPAEVIAGPR